MDIREVIQTRKSVRTFDGRELAAEDRERLCLYAESAGNPYGIPVSFVLLDAAEHGLSSPVIAGEHLYVAGKVPRVPHCEEAFGYSFEKLVLFAWSLGVGTTWIGGTMDRGLFERAAQTGESEAMMIVSPLGYPSTDRTVVDVKLRASIHGDERFSPAELFFDGSFSAPLEDAGALDLLEAVRWAPSAANLQPWRVVKDGTRFHFYERHTRGFRGGVAWDVQRIDLGIALCHFMETAGGTLLIDDPGIAVDKDVEYIATVAVD